MILDPFLGSGTTVVASRYTKRNAVGIELNKKYAELSNIDWTVFQVTTPNNLLLTMIQKI